MKLLVLLFFMIEIPGTIEKGSWLIMYLCLWMIKNTCLFIWVFTKWLQNITVWKWHLNLMVFRVLIERNVEILTMEAQKWMSERLQDAHLSPRFLYLSLCCRRTLCISVAICNWFPLEYNKKGEDMTLIIGN